MWKYSLSNPMRNLLLLCLLTLCYCGYNTDELLKKSYELFRNDEYAEVAEITSKIFDKDINHGNAGFLYGCALFELERYHESDSIFFLILVNPNIGLDLSKEQVELVRFRRTLAKMGQNEPEKLDSMIKVNINRYELLEIK